MSFRPLLVLDATWAWITYCTTHTCVCVFVCASVSMCQLQKADLKCPSQTNRATWCQAAKVQANLDDESASS